MTFGTSTNRNVQYQCTTCLTRPQWMHYLSVQRLYFFQLLEVESWLAEKVLVLDLPDYGQNDECTRALLRKVETVKLDLEGFESRIEKLKETGNCLLACDNPDRQARRKMTVDTFKNTNFKGRT